MAEEKIAVGDPVLWYGFKLNVVAIHDKGGVAVVEVADVAGLSAREDAMKQIQSLRAEQADKTGADHRALAVQIQALDITAREAMMRAKLRKDLLAYWPERKVWVSDGRILTTAQITRFEKVTGRKPLPDKQREVLDFLEGRN